MIIARCERLLAVAAAAIGLAAWIVFLRADLVLSHYDAKAHLVVGRRVIDSITPGWQQIGAVWLPLPHLINFLPTQIDLLYRTGLFASLVSIVCFGLTAYAMARLVVAVTGSRIGAATATALLAFNPNLLYLQSTPMTEPLLLVTVSFAILWLIEWARDGTDRVPTRLAAVLFAAMWTRYEAWLVLAAALPVALLASFLGRPKGRPLHSGKDQPRDRPLHLILRRAWNLGVWPAAAVVLFLVNSRIAVGAWFVSDGFYVPDPTYQHQLVRSLSAIWWGTHELSGYIVATVGMVTAIWLIYRGLVRMPDAALLIPVTLFAAAVLPLSAFYLGHPYRIRYMVPLVAACALMGGLAAGLARRATVPLATLLVISALIESPPWNAQAPMLLEAQWDRPASLGRRAVTDCLTREFRGEKILASMGSLAHYMQELSHSGFAIADFIHEGNGEIWKLALETGPAPHARWMLVEEHAEGGDQLAQRIRQDPAFTREMTKVCEGGGVALYKREQ